MGAAVIKQNLVSVASLVSERGERNGRGEGRQEGFLFLLLQESPRKNSLAAAHWLSS